MKQSVAIALCLFISGASFAQNSNTGKSNPNKSAIAGTIKNMNRQPVPGIRAIVYKKDSIVASGYTGQDGYFETNYTLPGTYSLKLVYPSEKTIIVDAVPVKARKITAMAFKMNAPEADTTISYLAVAPKEDTKK